MRKKYAALLLSFLLLMTISLPVLMEEGTSPAQEEEGSAVVLPVETSSAPEGDSNQTTIVVIPTPSLTLSITPYKDMPKPNPDAKAEAVVLQAEGLALYETPSTSGAELAQLDAATVVTLIDLGQTWSKVQSGAYTGYVTSSGLGFGFGSSQPALALVTAPNGKLTLREEMTTKSKAVATAKSGQLVLLFAKGETFSLVRYKDKEGYMLTQHLKEVAVNQESGTYTKVISLDSKREANVRLRAEPEKTAAVYTSVTSGKFLVVLDVKDNWAQVEYEGFHGYMMAEYLEK